jgi:aldose 1-epimerase
MKPILSQTRFGKTPDGAPVDIFTLRNAVGLEVRICNFGGIIVSVKAPDRAGHLGEVSLGYDDFQSYVANNPFFGALTGRVANRIARAKFTLDGVTYSLPANNGSNSLHGGLKGFDKVIWQVTRKAAAPDPTLELNYLSKDGEEGYPGNLNVKAVYSLTADNALRLDFTATTDKTTIVNLTQHAYFNLAGAGDVLGHLVYIDADRFTPIDTDMIPTGELRPVAGTPLDFRQPTAIGARVELDDEQLKRGHGYDHNFVLNHPMGRLDVVARVSEPSTGRVMELLTTEPGLQLYTGNFLDGTIRGMGGQVYVRRAGLCLEAQHFPNSPNQPAFPSIVLKPGAVYRNTIAFRFSCAPPAHA